MFTLIIGGSASGKSAYAEEYAARLGGRLLYIATMQPFDEESVRRIEKHRRQRAGKGFDTLECYTGAAIASADLPAGTGALLECVSNLVANDMYSPAGGGPNAALAGVLSLRGRCDHLTVVTNEVFSGGSDYEGDTLRYMRELARINREMASEADIVIEIICGLPNCLKGSELIS